MKNVFFVLCIYNVLFFISAFQIFDDMDLTNTRQTDAYFTPYEKGLPGYYGDPTTNRRERVNEGSPFSNAHPKRWQGALPRGT